MKRIFILSLVLAVCGITHASSETITFWTTEVEPERLQKQKSIAHAFEKISNISVRISPVQEDDLARKANQAFASGNLPDVLYAPWQYI